MSTQSPSRALLRLGWVVAVFYLLWGLVFGLMPSHWDEASVTEQVLYVAFLCGGSLLLMAGLRVFAGAPWTGTGLVFVGAFAGAAPIFWTLLLPVLAIVLTVLAVRDARRAGAATAVAD